MLCNSPAPKPTITRERVKERGAVDASNRGRGGKRREEESVTVWMDGEPSTGLCRHC